MRMLVALMGLVLSVTAFAADATFTEGKDYIVLAEPVRPADPSKIEVMEVFSYLCPHCYDFEPALAAWSKKQGADVQLLQTHASFQHNWPIYQRGYYTALTLKLKDKVHTPIFNSVHVAHKELLTAEDWGDFLSAYGVDKQTVINTYKSFGVSTQIKQADARVRDYKVTSTPQLVIDGKYRVNATSHENMLKVAQFLVDKVRADRAVTH